MKLSEFAGALTVAVVLAAAGAAVAIPPLMPPKVTTYCHPKNQAPVVSVLSAGNETLTFHFNRQVPASPPLAFNLVRTTHATAPTLFMNFQSGTYSLKVSQPGRSSKSVWFTMPACVSRRP